MPEADDRAVRPIDRVIGDMAQLSAELDDVQAQMTGLVVSVVLLSLLVGVMLWRRS